MTMIKLLGFVILCCGISAAYGQTWASRACLEGHVDYYRKVMQEVLLHIERDVKWCNMKLDNRGHVVNETLFTRRVTGTVNYTNGFVVSLQKADLSHIQPSVSTITTNGTQSTRMIVQGRLNLREIKVGFDVIANLDEFGAHRFTGEYSHILVDFATSIVWDRTTKELSTTAGHWSTSAGTGRHMAYWPANNVTEILSRGFNARDNGGFRTWAQDVIAPRMLTAAKKLQFPAVRFDGRC